jgi:hypothetical protein
MQAYFFIFGYLLEPNTETWCLLLLLFWTLTIEDHTIFNFLFLNSVFGKS